MTGKTFQLWVYVLSWIDGDTFRAGYIDQGFYTYRGTLTKPVSCRCAVINAPELSTGQPGLDAKAYAEKIAPPGEYQCTSFKPDEFGRPLVDLMLPAGLMFSDAMLTANQATLWKR